MVGMSPVPNIQRWGSEPRTDNEQEETFRQWRRKTPATWTGDIRRNDACMTRRKEEERIRRVVVVERVSPSLISTKESQSVDHVSELVIPGWPPVVCTQELGGVS